MPCRRTFSEALDAALDDEDAAREDDTAQFVLEAKQRAMRLERTLRKSSRDDEDAAREEDNTAEFDVLEAKQRASTFFYQKELNALRRERDEQVKEKVEVSVPGHLEGSLYYWSF